MKGKIIILGGGFTGCVVANELTKKGYDITIIEKNNYLGGGCHTFFWGGHPYTQGPHPYFIDKEENFNYINDIVPMRIFPLYLDTYIEQDRSFNTFPIHMDDIRMMSDREQIYKELENTPKVNNATNFEDGWINAVGETLYKKYVKTYTEKMWKVDSNKIFEDYSWSVKGRPIQEGDRAVALDGKNNLHAYPIENTGYNRFFEVCTSGSKVILRQCVTKIDLEKKIVYLDGNELKADLIISTISLDDLMNNAYGKLRYMGRDFIPIVLPVEHCFRDDRHFIHYPNSEVYTRIVEYKNLTLHKAPDTLIVVEIPSDNGKLYAYPIRSEIEKAQKYLDNLPKGVLAVGRLGTYQSNSPSMGDCIDQVRELIKENFE